MPAHHEWDEEAENENIVPTGSKFADLSTVPDLNHLLLRKDKKLIKQERGKCIYIGF